MVDWAVGSAVLEFSLWHKKIRETPHVLNAPFDPMINRIAGGKNQEKSLGKQFNLESDFISHKWIWLARGRHNNSLLS